MKRILIIIVGCIAISACSKKTTIQIVNDREDTKSTNQLSENIEMVYNSYGKIEWFSVFSDDMKISIMINNVIDKGGKSEIIDIEDNYDRLNIRYGHKLDRVDYDCGNIVYKDTFDWGGDKSINIEKGKHNVIRITNENDVIQLNKPL